MSAVAAFIAGVLSTLLGLWGAYKAWRIRQGWW